MKQDKPNKEMTATPSPFRGHWTLYSKQTGINSMVMTHPQQFNGLRQTYFAGGLAALAILDMRGVDLTEVGDLAAELAQFAKSQNALAAAEAEAANKSDEEFEEVDDESEIVDPVKERMQTIALGAQLGLPDLEKL